MKEALSKISGELLWPAAAGNVIWSFLSLLFDPNASLHHRAPHLFTLLLVGAYLSGNWVRRMAHGSNDGLFIGYDYIHLLLVSAFALSLYYKSPFASIVLHVLLLSVASMHLFGAGPTTRVNWKLKTIFALINASGVAVFWVTSAILPTAGDWRMTVAVGFVLLSWSSGLWVFRKELRGIAAQPDSLPSG
jgi:hypothetical protein